MGNVNQYNSFPKPQPGHSFPSALALATVEASVRAGLSGRPRSLGRRFAFSLAYRLLARIVLR